VRETAPEARLCHDIPAASRREAGATVYEMLVPWRRLDPSGVVAGRVFRMNVIANDSDGRGRKCWIGLTPGIAEGKRPAVFRQWVLQAPAAPFPPTRQAPPIASRELPRSGNGTH